jgi:hypothetical protein
MKKSLPALLIAAVSFPVVTMLAQGTSPSVSTKTVPVFRGNGVDRVPRGRKPPPPPPPPFSPSVFAGVVTMLGKVEPGSTYVELNPTHPAVPNKGVLLFWDASLVETGENYAFWGEKKIKGGAPGSMDLWIWSPASRKYGIDCTLSGYQFGSIAVGSIGRRGPAFKVIGPDGSSHVFDFSETIVSGPETFSDFDLFQTENGGAHLSFGLVVGTKGWYGFQILPQKSFSYLESGALGLAQWAFFSCKVLNATANVPGKLSPEKKSR